MRATGFMISAVIFVSILTSASAAQMDDYDPLRGTNEICQNNSAFAGAVIQPNSDTGYQLLQCKNETGSSYYIDLSSMSITDDDPNWMKIPYPKAWICFGNQPEDCHYYKQE